MPRPAAAELLRAPCTHPPVAHTTSVLPRLSLALMPGGARGPCRGGRLSPGSSPWAAPLGGGDDLHTAAGILF